MLAAVVEAVTQRPDLGIGEGTVADYLYDVAARTPVPAGGAVTALTAAQAAALLGMGARFSSGASGDAEWLGAHEVATDADRLRVRALALADEDGEAFTAVRTAYALPRHDDRARRRRRAAIQDAVADAAGPPAEVFEVARELLALAERLMPVANPTVVADLAVAVEAVSAATCCARLIVEVNLRGLPEDDERTALLDRVADTEQLLGRVAAVRALAQGRLGA